MIKEEIIAYIGVVAGPLIESMEIDCEYRDLLPVCVRTANEFWDDNITIIETSNIDDIRKNLDIFATEKLLSNFSSNFNYKEAAKKYCKLLEI